MSSTARERQSSRMPPKTHVFNCVAELDPESAADIADITEKLIALHHITEAPVPVYKMIERHDLALEIVTFDNDIFKRKVTAYSYTKDNRRTICVNDDMDVRDKNYGMAREFGRFFLDPDSRLPACSYWDSIFPKADTHESDLALNCFAEHLLIPGSLTNKIRHVIHDIDMEKLSLMFLAPVLAVKSRTGGS